MLRCALRPTLHPLLLAHLFHDDPKEVAAVPHAHHDLLADLIAVKARQRVEPTAVPRLEQIALVAGNAQVAEPGLQKIDNVGFGPVNSKVPRRQDRVIEQRRTRPAAPDYENRCLAPPSHTFLRNGWHFCALHDHEVLGYLVSWCGADVLRKHSSPEFRLPM